MTQIARNLTNPHDGFLRDVPYLILDRDRSTPAHSKIYYETVV